ncbi:MAG: hypothetical protein Q8P90_00085 [bacterium]|nr:hypothetical protein [bacterium]
MSRNVRIIIIIAVIIVVIGLLAVSISKWRSQPNETDIENAAAEQLLQEQLSIINSSSEKLLYASSSSQQDMSQLHITDFITDDIALLSDSIGNHYSNFLADTNVWYTVNNNTIFKNTFLEEPRVIGSTMNVVSSSANSERYDIALSKDQTKLAWVTGVQTQQKIVTYNLDTGTETIIFGEDEPGTFSNLTWSPSGQELAFLRGDDNIIIIEATGVQNLNPITISYTEFNNLEWIEENLIAAVLSTQDNHPDPYDPKIGLINREGTIMEEHELIDSIGIPVVLWSYDGKDFLYYNPWKHQFIAFNRFDEVQLIASVKSSGSLAPFGWTMGIRTPLISDSAAADIIAQLNGNEVVEQSTFDVTAEDWEKYNSTVRSILQQFAMDLNTYRFAVTETGVAVQIWSTPQETEIEKVFIQTLLQTLNMIPGIPSISLTMTSADEIIFNVEEFTRDDADKLLAHFTAQPLDSIFIINKKNPQGKLATKVNEPNYTYLGDLIYSKNGDYNPYPALAFIGTNVSDTRMLWTDTYSLAYPQDWSLKDRGETVGAPYQSGDMIFYTNATEFLSETSWNGFAAQIRSYKVTDVSLDEWLFVNRNDATTEDVGFDLHPPLTGKHIITDSEFNDEYVLHDNDNIYVLSIERPPTLEEIDKEDLKNMVITFSSNATFNR